MRKLCNSTGCWGIVSMGLQSDPNWYKNSPFRKELKDLIKTKDIKTVLDLHGKREGSENMLEVYLNNKFKDKFSNILKQFKFPVRDFKNDPQLTISEDLDNLNIPALEIEIRREARVIDSKEFKNMLKILKSLINTIKEKS